MIGLTSEITDEVSFGRRDHHLHILSQIKQVWSSALLKAMSPCALLHLRLVRKVPSWETMWSCLHVSVCVCILASASASASASQEQSRHVAIQRICKLRRAHTPCVQLGILRHVLHVCIRPWSGKHLPSTEWYLQWAQMSLLIGWTHHHPWRLCLLHRRTSERARTSSSSSSRSCSRLISLLTFNTLDAVMVYTLKWWAGSCHSHHVRPACTGLYTRLIWVEDAHQDTHMETDKTQMQMQMRTQTQTQTQMRTWSCSFRAQARFEPEPTFTDCQPDALASRQTLPHTINQSILYSANIPGKARLTALETWMPPSRITQLVLTLFELLFTVKEVTHIAKTLGLLSSS